MTKIHNMSIIFAAVGLKLTCGAILLSWFWPERAFIYNTINHLFVHLYVYIQINHIYFFSVIQIQINIHCHSCACIGSRKSVIIIYFISINIRYSSEYVISNVIICCPVFWICIKIVACFGYINKNMLTVQWIRSCFSKIDHQSNIVNLCLLPGLLNTNNKSPLLPTAELCFLQRLT